MVAVWSPGVLARGRRRVALLTSAPPLLSTGGVPGGVPAAALPAAPARATEAPPPTDSEVRRPPPCEVRSLKK
jgi:hypothetical protein